MMRHIAKIFSDLKYFNWGLYASLIAVALFPAILQTVRTFFLSSTVDVSEFDVLGQMEWFDLLSESIKALLIIPLYSILSNELKKGREAFARQVFKAGLTVFLTYAALSSIIYGAARYLVEFMNPETADIEAIADYLNLETLAFAIGIIPQFVSVVFVLIGKKRNFYAYVIVNSLLLILTDYLLIPTYGVNGVAYSNILINGVLAIAMLIIMAVERQIRPAWFDKNDKDMYLSWLKVGLPSIGQSLLDNGIYILMVAKMVNSVSSAGNYWVVNNFIWLWLLIPVTALGEIIRKDAGDGYKQLKQSKYYLIIGFIVVLWLTLIPSWLPFFRHVERLENAEEIFQITLKLFGFYIAYALCQIPDNIFVGLGKTKYSLLNSIIINIGYYGIFYLVYKFAGLKMTLDTIIMMFGFGMVVHLAVSWAEEKLLLLHEIRKTDKPVDSNI